MSTYTCSPTYVAGGDVDALYDLFVVFPKKASTMVQKAYSSLDNKPDDWSEW